MTKLFLIQTQMGHPDPWDDAINISNVSINPGLGITNNNNAEGYESVISFFQRVDNRFVISTTEDPDADLVLKKPYSVDSIHGGIKLKFDYIASVIEGTVDGIALYASPLNNINNHQDAVQNASFYMRRTDGKVVNVVTAEVIENPNFIPWFFVFKTKDLPLYYIVMNPHAVQITGNFDGEYGDNKVYAISNHLKNLNDLIFKPKLSKNARQIGDHNIMVKGDSFTVEPFGTWFVKKHLEGFFDGVQIKVDTNFDFTVEGNKVRINTLNKKRGFLSIRWNTGTVMDMTFNASKNRFLKEYIIDVIE